jgi:hypothetical protein
VYHPCLIFIAGSTEICSKEIVGKNPDLLEIPLMEVALYLWVTAKFILKILSKAS